MTIGWKWDEWRMDMGWIECDEYQETELMKTREAVRDRSHPVGKFGGSCDTGNRSRVSYSFLKPVR